MAKSRLKTTGEELGSSEVLERVPKHRQATPARRRDERRARALRVTRDDDRPLGGQKPRSARGRAGRPSASVLLRSPFFEAPLHVSAVRRESWVRRSLACADVVAGAGALVLVGMLYPAGSVLSVPILVMLPVLLLVSRALGLYHTDEIRLRQSTLDEARALFELAALYALGVWLARHALVGGELAGSHVMTLLVVFLAMAFCFRVAGRGAARLILAPERCLVIGSADAIRRLERALDVAAQSSVIAASIFCDTAAEEEERFATLSRHDDLRAVVETAHVDRLIIAPGHPATEQVLSLVHAAKSLGLRVTILPFLGELMGAAAQVENVGGVTVLGLPRFALSRSSRATKRALDLVGAVTGLLLLGPLMVVLAALIKVDSRGPFLFRQIRTGRDGQSFSIVKFRTMVEDADAQKPQLLSKSEAVGLFKMSRDPRVTRVGRFLRRTSLDELPQLWNVLRGDMSLVGPRPLIPDEDAKVVGSFRHRLHLQPGITGHWQVLGSSRIPLDDMIRIDYLYVANWSLWGDIKLLLQTVPYVLGARGL